VGHDHVGLWALKIFVSHKLVVGRSEEGGKCLVTLFDRVYF
jgi:hypothetical protein